MRIEKIVIQNINSLAGRFEIDFSAAEYAEGLFAIVGPSGAGKTTVLDALCLALYGKTPRIDTISETHDEIMNKNASSCLAEAVFISRGKRYKSRFAHERRKGDKPFRPVKREIVEYGADEDGTIVASTIKEAAEKMVEITGLSFGQFTRSILLAQFQFAEFLNADSNERAGILEQITDMEVYRTISAAVFERAKSEKAALETIQVRIESVSVLEADQRKALEKEKEQMEGMIASHRRLRDGYSFCRDTGKEIAGLLAERDRYRRREAELEAGMATQERRFVQAVAEEENAVRIQQALKKTLTVVRDLDAKTAVQRAETERCDKEIAAGADKIQAFKRSILNLFGKYIPEADGAAMKALYESADTADLIRTGAKADLDAAAESEAHLRGEIRETLGQKDEKQWGETIAALRIAAPLFEARVLLGQAAREMEERKERHKSLVLEDTALEDKVKEIEDKYVYARLEEKFGQERRKLEPGNPCPLCGATDHPSADQPFDAGFLAAVENERREILADKKNAAQALDDNQKRIVTLEKDMEKQAAIARKTESALKNMGPGTEAVAAALAEKEDAAGEAERVTHLYTDLLQKLSDAARTVAMLTQRMGEVDQDVLVIEHNKQMIRDATAQTEAKQKERDAARALFDQYSAERQELFGQKDPDAEEENAEKAVEKARQNREECRAQKETAFREAEQNKRDIERTAKAAETKKEALNKALAGALAQTKQVCSMPEIGDAAIRELRDRFCAAAGSLGGTAETADDEALRRTIALLDDMVSAQTKRQGAVDQWLQSDAENKTTVRGLKQDEKTQRQTCAKWDRLSALIGSSDGVKFSRMAQGITFEVLLHYANSNLRRMSDRFLLVRDTSNPAKPLELSVADIYQAGEIRPVRNLSGGESFVVSLALALALSEMSSGKTRIDSLFIDEGFASLDEDYLEAALQTLSTLGTREGKLVGVISHVGALKERIDTKIEVGKLSGGRSTLAGPGVSVQAE